MSVYMYIYIYYYYGVFNRFSLEKKKTPRIHPLISDAPRGTQLSPVLRWLAAQQLQAQESRAGRLLLLAWWPLVAARNGGKVGMVWLYGIFVA